MYYLASERLWCKFNRDWALPSKANCDFMLLINKYLQNKRVISGMSKKVSGDCYIGSVKVSSRKVSGKVPRKVSEVMRKTIENAENAEKTAGWSFYYPLLHTFIYFVGMCDKFVEWTPCDHSSRYCKHIIIKITKQFIDRE